MIYTLSTLDDNILRIIGSPSEEDTLYYNTFTIHVIKYKSTKSEKTEVLKILMTPHDGEYCEALYEFVKDGHYIVDHLVILDKTFALENQLVGYVTDGNDIYRLDESGNVTQVTPDELIESQDESIIRYSQETFSVYYLHTCYLHLCHKKFKDLMRNRCITKDEAEDFDLDLIGLSLSAIRYNLEFGYTTTAQAIVEDLQSCTNVCKKYTNHECCCGC